MKTTLEIFLGALLAIVNASLGWTLYGFLPLGSALSATWIEILFASLLLAFVGYLLLALLELSPAGRWLALWFLTLIAGLLTYYAGGASRLLPWAITLGLIGILAHPLETTEKVFVALCIWAWAIGGMYMFWGLLPAEIFPLFFDDGWVPLALSTAFLLLAEISRWRDASLQPQEKLESPQVAEETKPAQTAKLGALDDDTRDHHSEATSLTDVVDAEAMRSILDPVVFFMSRNFKAYTSLGFVADPTGNTFELNAFYSRGGKIKANTTIEWGKGLLGEVASKGKGFFSGELKRYGAELDYYKSGSEEINSIMAIPIQRPGEKRVEGLLVVDSDRVRAFDDQNKELLKRFGQIALAMLVNARLTQQVKNQADWADTLYEVSQKLNQSLGNREIFQILTETLKILFVSDRMLVCTYNAQSAKGLSWQVHPAEAGQKPVRDEFSLSDEQSLYAKVFRTGKDLLVTNFRTDRHWHRLSDGDSATQRPAELLLSPLLDDKGAVLAVVGLESMASGVYTARELQRVNTLMANFSIALVKARMMDELERLATIDGLTGIANHRKLQETLDEEMRRVDRYRGQMAFFLLDIDHFKKFNDTYGHPLGDKVLKCVAEAIQASIRSTDMCARYGGEEFAVVMLHASLEKALALGERIRRAIEGKVLIHEGKELHVTVSLGCALYPSDALDKKEWIDKADKAMYVSKEAGRNRLTMHNLNVS